MLKRYHLFLLGVLSCMCFAVSGENLSEYACEITGKTNSGKNIYLVDSRQQKKILLLLLRVHPLVLIVLLVKILSS